MWKTLENDDVVGLQVIRDNDQQIPAMVAHPLDVAAHDMP
jgi:hypothetical protein